MLNQHPQLIPDILGTVENWDTPSLPVQQPLKCRLCHSLRVISVRQHRFVLSSPTRIPPDLPPCIPHRFRPKSAQHTAIQLGHPPPPIRRQDRKSTRLNSS